MRIKIAENATETCPKIECLINFYPLPSIPSIKNTEPKRAKEKTIEIEKTVFIVIAKAFLFIASPDAFWQNAALNVSAYIVECIS